MEDLSKTQQAPETKSTKKVRETSESRRKKTKATGNKNDIPEDIPTQQTKRAATEEVPPEEEIVEFLNTLAEQEERTATCVEDTNITTTNPKTKVSSTPETPPPWLGMILQQLTSMSTETKSQLYNMSTETNARLDENNARLEENNSRLDNMALEVKGSAQKLKEELLDKIENMSQQFNHRLETQSRRFDAQLEQQRAQLKEEMRVLNQQNREEYHGQLTEQNGELNKRITLSQEETVSICKKYTDKECSTVREILNDTLRQTQEELNNNSQQIQQIERRTSTLDNQICAKILNLEQQQANKIQQIHVTCNGTSHGGTDNLIPRFHGREHNPMEHLQKIRRHFERKKLGSGNEEDIELLRDTLESCMEGHASRWFTLIKEEIREWDDFEETFKKKYWSREVQRGIRQRMDIERFRPQGKLSRAEYFTERVITLKAIQPPMHEEEIVTCLAEHFEEIIQDARRVQNLQTISEFELLLQREDLKESHNQTRRRNFQNLPPRSIHNRNYQEPQFNQNRPLRQNFQQQNQDRAPLRKFDGFQPRFPGFLPQNTTRPPQTRFGTQPPRGPYPPTNHERQRTSGTQRPELNFHQRENDQRPRYHDARHSDHSTNRPASICHAVAERTRTPSPTRRSPEPPSGN